MEMIVESVKIKVKLFKTRSAAENYIKAGKGSEIIYFRSHEYYVSIND